MPDLEINGMKFSYWADITSDFTQIKALEYTATLSTDEKFYLFQYRICGDGARSLRVTPKHPDAINDCVIEGVSLYAAPIYLASILETHAKSIMDNPTETIADRIEDLILGYESQIQKDLECVELSRYTVSRMRDRLKELRPDEH